MSSADAAAWPYPAPEDDGGARHLVAGLQMPAVALASTHGGVVDLAGANVRAVVFVYPWTGRPGLPNPPDWDTIKGAHGSTPEALAFEHVLPRFTAKRWSVFGLSGQASEDQREFAQRCGLTFPLLSDAAGALQEALRLPVFETGGVRYLRRLTLVIEGGVLVRAIYPVHPPHTHAFDVVEQV